MSTKFEMAAEIRARFGDILPKPIHKLTRPEMEKVLHTLKGINGEQAKEVAIFGKTGPAPPRAIPTKKTTADDLELSVPTLPKKRVTNLSPPEERKAYKVAIGAPAQPVIKKMPAGFEKMRAAGEAMRAAKRAEKDAATAKLKEDAGLFPTKKAAPVEDDTDPRAARIVRSHGPSEAAPKRGPGRPKKVTEAVGGAGIAPPGPPPEMMAAFTAWYAKQSAPKAEDEE